MGERRLPLNVKQTKISPMDIRNAGTPDGTAQVNEEFRRIQLQLAPIS